jgi:capsular exopolysaccharide synthesis family protein
MSRVYDALQQCLPDQVIPGTSQVDSADAPFSEQFADSVWDQEGAPTVELDSSNEERIPVLFAIHGFASEQFRLLAMRLQQLQQSRALKSVLLTSSVAEEGKSLLTLNLAMSLAQGGQQKILVIDADLRKPGACRTLKVDDRPGLREWYQTNRPVTDFICRIAGVNVWALPAGLTSVDPLELLKSPRMPGLLTSMNRAFDWVLIDSAPLLPIADAEIISRISDGTIIVVRRDKSPKTALKQALERVAPSKMIGFLLNGFPAIGEYADARYSEGSAPKVAA